MPKTGTGKEELSGLAWILKQVMNETLEDPKTWNAIKKLKGTLVIRETDSHAAVSIFFHNGELRIQNGAIDQPTAFVEGKFEELSEISMGQNGPLWALLSRKIKARGNLFKLVKMSKVIISRKK
jgi:putative sterol carrier protein